MSRMLSFQPNTKQFDALLFKWFKNISGKRVYGGGASVKKRTAPTEWTATVPFMLPDDFICCYVAMRCQWQGIVVKD